MTLANSGLPYPIRCSAEGCAQIELPGVPLGSFHGSTYDEISFALHAGDVFVFCTDGVFEAMNEHGQEFTAARLLDVVGGARDLPPRQIVEEIARQLREWRGTAPAQRRHDRGCGADHALIDAISRLLKSRSRLLNVQADRTVRRRCRRR